jgi:alanyl-tRNA synthetase
LFIVVIGDRVRPSNAGRGYVLRRLIRRALTTLWRDDVSRTLSDLPVGLLEHTLGHFEQDTEVRHVREVLVDEERRFGELLERGRTVLSRRRSGGPLSEEDFHYLHDTHGLPRELIVGLLSDQS